MDIIYPTSASPPTYGYADLINLKSVKNLSKEFYWVAAKAMKKKLFYLKK